MNLKSVSNFIIVILGYYSIQGVYDILTIYNMGTNTNVFILSIYTFILILSLDLLSNKMLQLKYSITRKEEQRKEDTNE